MTTLLIALLFLALYAVIVLIVIELIFYVIGLFFTFPPKIKQLIYAIVGVIFLIKLLQLVLGLPYK